MRIGPRIILNVVTLRIQIAPKKLKLVGEIVEAFRLRKSSEVLQEDVWTLKIVGNLIATSSSIPT
jgi:hypothetical protein